jgi:hypothetical protein
MIAGEELTEDFRSLLDKGPMSAHVWLTNLGSQFHKERRRLCGSRRGEKGSMSIAGRPISDTGLEP